MNVKELKEHLQETIERLEEIDDSIELTYFTMDEGGYTDGITIEDFYLSFSEDDGELSGSVEVDPVD